MGGGSVGVAVGVAVLCDSIFRVLSGVGDSLVLDGVAVNVESTPGKDVGRGVLVGVSFGPDVAVGVLEV